MTDAEYLQDFDKLYDHFFDLIYRFVVRRIEDKETAHDIVSETFMKVYNHLSSFEPRGEGSLSSWIYRIAKNEILQHIRTQKNKKTVALSDVPEIFVPENFSAEVDCERLHGTVMNLLQQLDTEDRELIVHKYFDELNNIEIANICKISPNALGVRLHRALQKCKKIMKNNPMTPWNI